MTFPGSTLALARTRLAGFFGPDNNQAALEARMTLHRWFYDAMWDNMTDVVLRDGFLSAMPHADGQRAILVFDVFPDRETLQQLAQLEADLAPDFVCVSVEAFAGVEPDDCED